MAGYRQVTLNDVYASRVKGGYILFALLHSKRSIRVGKLGTILFPPGSYAYLGSALAGFKLRISRHLSGNKKPRWHIDYLLAHADVAAVILCETRRRLECLLARSLAGEIHFIPGFGSSDCRCHSHLFGPCNTESLNDAISRAIAEVVWPTEPLAELTGFSKQLPRIHNMVIHPINTVM